MSMRRATLILLLVAGLCGCGQVFAPKKPTHAEADLQKICEVYCAYGCNADAWDSSLTRIEAFKTAHWQGHGEDANGAIEDLIDKLSGAPNEHALRSMYSDTGEVRP